MRQSTRPQLLAVWRTRNYCSPTRKLTYEGAVYSCKALAEKLGISRKTVMRRVVAGIITETS